MQKSYEAKTTIHFIDFGFYVRPGDLLVHDSTSHKMTVYRSGQIAKVVKQTPLGIAAFLKNKFIVEPPTAAPVAPAPPKAAPVVTEAPVTQPTKAEIAQKRRKAQGEEIHITDAPRLMEALGIKEETPTEPEETTVE